MGNKWRPDGTGVSGGGDVGGDIQAADSYDIRFIHPDLPRAVITVWVYPVVADEKQFDHDPPDGPFTIQIQTEYTICDDVRDPGSTEEWADARYEDLPAKYASLRSAERDTARIADQFAAGKRLPARNWDGEVFR
jgi:hypothetical protein